MPDLEAKIKKEFKSPEELLNYISNLTDLDKGNLETLSHLNPLNLYAESKTEGGSVAKFCAAAYFLKRLQEVLR